MFRCINGFGKSPISALRFILCHSTYIRTPRSSGLARLELEAFYFAIGSISLIQVYDE